MEETYDKLALVDKQIAALWEIGETEELQFIFIVASVVRHVGRKVAKQLEDR